MQERQRSQNVMPSTSLSHQLWRDTLLSLPTERLMKPFANLLEEAIDDDTKPYLRTTNEVEMYAMFGMMYFRGLLSLNHLNVLQLFAEKTGHHVWGVLCKGNASPSLQATCAMMTTKLTARIGRRIGLLLSGISSKCSTRHAVNMSHPAT